MVFIAAIPGKIGPDNTFLCFWLGVIIISNSLLRELYYDDIRSGKFTQLIMVPSSPFSVFLAYWAYHAVTFFLSSWLYYLLILFFLNTFMFSFVNLIPSLLFISLLNAMIALITALNTRASMLTMILLFPFYLPVIIFSSTTGSNEKGLAFLIGFALLLAPIIVCLAAKLIVTVIEEG
jgi:ABC-type transport system involved in cytochrome c biogenesis permease component